MFFQTCSNAHLGRVCGKKYFVILYINTINFFILDFVTYVTSLDRICIMCVFGDSSKCPPMGTLLTAVRHQ